MISIYIVDDEPMAIRYLEMLLASTGFPCEVVGRQTNSTRAYYEIRTMHPDVVFTDISMPVMNGLELAEKVIKCCDSRVYLLTSYEDFEYAKKGVRIGVCDYLLKNELTEQLLKGVLEESVREIDIQRRQRQSFLEHNIRQFLLGNSQIPEDHAYEERALQRYALLIFYKPPRFSMDPDAGTDEVPALDTYALQHMDFPSGLRCAAFAQVQARAYCAVVFISETVADSRRRVFQMADALLSKISDTDTGWKCIGSDICLHFFELQAQYRELEKRTAYLYAHREHSVFGINDVSAPAETSIGSDALLGELDRLLSGGKHEKAVSTATAFFEACRRQDTQAVYLEHVREFYRLLKRNALRDGHGLSCLAISPVYSGTADLERALLNCVELYFEERTQAEKMHYSEHVLKAQEFIRREYARDIPVSEIAEYAGISEGHLRRLFKQEMDMSVVDYLTEYRIRQAKHLLREHLVPSSDIWKETGFSSSQYFSYVFKKREGVSPREFQKAGSESDRTGQSV